MTKLKIKKILLVFITLLAFSLYATPCVPLFETYFIVNDKLYFGNPNANEEWIYVENAQDIRMFKASDNTYLTENADRFTLVKDANLKSLKIDKSSEIYARDKRNVYYKGHKIKDAVASSFVFLGGIKTLTHDEGYLKDNQSVFFNTSKIDSADVSSFQVIQPYYNYAGVYDQGYAYDKNRVYFYGMVTSYDPGSFAVLGWGYTKDKNGIYCNGKLLVETANKEYYQNKLVLICDGKLYFSGYQMKGFDTDTYRVHTIYMKEATSCGGILMGGILAQDKNGIYLDKTLLDWLDYASFEVVNDYTIKDKNGTYNFVYPNYGKEAYQPFVKKVK